LAKQPAVRWTQPPHLDVVGPYGFGAVAFDKSGIQQALFGLEGTQLAIPIQQQGINPQTGSWEYFLSIPFGLPSANYALRAGAVAGDFTERVLPSLPTNVFAAAATYVDKYVNADTGNDSTGTGAVGNPYLTIKKALESLAGVGGGGRVYLQNATAGYAVTVPSVAAATATRYVNIELAPGGTKANAVITSWAAAIGSTKVRLRSVTIRCPLIGAATDTLLLDDCHLQGLGVATAIGAAGWTPSWGARYFTEGEVSTCLNGLFAFDMVRNATLTSIGGSAFQSCAYVIDSIATTCGAGITLIDSASQDNFIHYNVQCFDCAVGMELHPSLAQTLSNSAYVNVIADASLYSRIRDYALDNVLLQNCDFVGAAVFTLSTNALTDFDVRQVCFKTLAKSAGDILGAPQGSQLVQACDDCHYITPDATVGAPGGGATTGSAAFINEGANDFTPAAGSDLFDLHTAPKAAPCDAEKIPRSNPTTVGALRGVDEPLAPGTLPPTDLDYNPAGSGILQVIEFVGTPITPITPTFAGTVTKFEVLPSIYHAYQAPPEVPCDVTMAHFEVRVWQAGDPTDPTIPGGHNSAVVVDLRNGHVYLKNPKVPGNEKFCALATAMNLCAPFASGAVEDPRDHFPIPDGPAERPVIRYRGDAIGGIFESSGNNLSDACDIGAHPDSGGSHVMRVVAWAGEPGTTLGGFFPIGGSTSSAPLGKGRQIRLSVIGATGGKQDRIIGPHTMGYGFKNSGVADPTWAPIDILFKDLTFSCNFDGHVSGTSQGVFQSPDKQGKTGRLRLYDYTFVGDNSGLSYGYGVKTWIEVDAGAHFDFRRGSYPPALEHANYLQGLNAGLLRNATLSSGETADSWFIDLVLTNGTNRCMFHLVDRPWDQLEQGAGIGTCTTPSPAAKARWGGKGVVLMERCQVLQGSDNEQGSDFNLVSGADMTFILRSNVIKMQAPLGKGSAIPLSPGGFKTVTIHERGVLAYSENGQSLVGFMCPGFFAGQSARINENGFNTRRVVLIDHQDHVDQPNEKRMSFRGVEEVHIYDFNLTCDVGAAKPAIEIDAFDSSPFSPYYGEDLLYQFDLEGNLVYSANPSFGTPISNGGPKYPHTGRVFLYMGYPSQPVAYTGWIAGGERMVGCIWPSTAPSHSFSQAEINALAGAPIYLPNGLTIDQGTGAITGTPLEGIGIDPAGGILGHEIDSPGTYTAGLPSYANIPIKASNDSGPDAWDSDGFQLIIPGSLAPGDVFIVPPIAERRWFFDHITVNAKVAKTAPTAERRWFFDQVIVDDIGGPDIVVPPTAERVWFFEAPTVDATNTITPPTAERFWFFEQVGSGVEAGEFAGQVLTPGCEVGEVVVL
jgi:hypothetical protein